MAISGTYKLAAPVLHHIKIIQNNYYVYYLALEMLFYLLPPFRNTIQ